MVLEKNVLLSSFSSLQLFNLMIAGIYQQKGYLFCSVKEVHDSKGEIFLLFCSLLSYLYFESDGNSFTAFF